MKVASNPPFCGVHGVALMMTRVPIDERSPLLGRVNALECPVTKAIVSKNPKVKP
jgi:hypothetical protein